MNEPERNARVLPRQSPPSPLRMYLWQEAVLICVLKAAGRRTFLKHECVDSYTCVSQVKYYLYEFRHMCPICYVYIVMI